MVNVKHSLTFGFPAFLIPALQRMLGQIKKLRTFLFIKFNLCKQ